MPRSQPETVDRAGKPARILFAEDDDLTSRLLADLLSDIAGIEVTRANDGEEALRLARVGSFDLVLMDMEMPHVDGFQATRKLRQAGIGVPIIALTAHALDGDRRRCIAAGCTDYLSKPFRRQALLETLKMYLPSLHQHLVEQAKPSGVRADRDTSARPGQGKDAERVVDLAQLIDRFGDERSVVEFMPAYLDTTAKHMTTLATAVETGQTKETARLAHALRGAALNLGANRLAEAAHQLERAGRREDADDATARLVTVRGEYDKVRAFLSRHGDPADWLF